jgi:hypothetical protein
MKVSSQGSEVPPLSLVPDDNELEQNNNVKKGTFKLRLDPADTTSQKYSFTMAYTDRSQLIRFQIKWVKDVLKVLCGMGVAMSAAQHELIQQLCLGQVLTQYNKSIKIACQTAKRARTIAIVMALVQGAAEMPAEFLVRQANA